MYHFRTTKKAYSNPSLGWSPYLLHPFPGLPDAGRGGVDDPDGVPGPVWGGEQEPGDEEPGSEPGGLLEEAEHQSSDELIIAILTWFKMNFLHDIGCQKNIITNLNWNLNLTEWMTRQQGRIVRRSGLNNENNKNLNKK